MVKYMCLSFDAARSKIKIKRTTYSVHGPRWDTKIKTKPDPQNDQNTSSITLTHRSKYLIDLHRFKEKPQYPKSKYLKYLTYLCPGPRWDDTKSNQYKIRSMWAAVAEPTDEGRGGGARDGVGDEAEEPGTVLEMRPGRRPRRPSRRSGRRGHGWPPRHPSHRRDLPGC